ALLRWIHTENFENKIRTDGFIWDSVLHFLVK
ncbi:MAG: putative peptidoglycan binding domain-containing protein, partial [Candidatus Kariarchaeaceae archaeon]